MQPAVADYQVGYNDQVVSKLGAPWTSYYAAQCGQAVLQSSMVHSGPTTMNTGTGMAWAFLSSVLWWWIDPLENKNLQTWSMVGTCDSQFSNPYQCLAPSGTELSLLTFKLSLAATCCAAPMDWSWSLLILALATGMSGGTAEQLPRWTQWWSQRFMVKEPCLVISGPYQSLMVPIRSTMEPPQHLLRSTPRFSGLLGYHSLDFGNHRHPKYSLQWCWCW